MHANVILPNCTFFLPAVSFTMQITHYFKNTHDTIDLLITIILGNYRLSRHRMLSNYCEFHSVFTELIVTVL